MNDQDKKTQSQTQAEACLTSNIELIELYDATNEKDLPPGVSKLEFILTRAYANGVYWAELQRKRKEGDTCTQ